MDQEADISLLYVRSIGYWLLQSIAHRPPEDASRRAEVERAALGVGVVPFLLELHVFHLVADDCGSTRDSPGTADKREGK